jgi:predicted RND superfamily exporter protein
VRTSHINSASRGDLGRSATCSRNAPARHLPPRRHRCCAADEMAWSQFVGTFVEILVLFSVAHLVIGSVPLTLIAFTANLLPIFGVYGLLSLLGETLNMGTTTIAAISLGIGVDDTIHFVVRYLNAYRRCGSALKSARRVIHAAGMSMLLASTMIALSFLSLSLSNIKPIFQLGVYTVVTMALCFASNIFFVPVAISLAFGRGRSRVDSPPDGG